MDGSLADNATLLPNFQSNPLDFLNSAAEDSAFADTSSWLWGDVLVSENDPLDQQTLDDALAATLCNTQEEYSTSDISGLPAAGAIEDACFAGLDSLPELEFPWSPTGSCTSQAVLGAADNDRPLNTDGEPDQGKSGAGNRKRPNDSASPSTQPSNRRKTTRCASPKRRAKLSEASKTALEASYADNAYPTVNDVERLVKETGVGEKQIKTWFNNKRCRTALKRTESDGRPASASSNDLTGQTFGSRLADVPQIDPKSLLERYLEIPLGEDPRIRTAVPQEPDQDVEHGLENGSESSWSSCGSNASWSSRKGRARSRWTTRHRRTQSYKLEDEPRNFCCTFCGQNDLKDQHQWKRHEGPRHAPQSGWVCKHPDCGGRRLEENIFFRKDLFGQHYRKHVKQSGQQGDDCHEEKHWKVETVQANPISANHPALSCGFCGDWLPDWHSCVKHVATHYARGADLSQWWLKRAQFVADLSGPRYLSVSRHLAPLMCNSVYCVHCKRPYLSIKEAERLHPTDCAMWSCGWFEGVRAAYSQINRSTWEESWRCKYCGDVVFEFGPDYSKRLAHLVRVHAYRSCAPAAYSELLQFQHHLTSVHRASPHREDGVLESACRSTRTSRFEPAAAYFQEWSSIQDITTDPDSSETDLERSDLPVDVFLRSECGALQGTARIQTLFDPAYSVSFIDRKSVEEIGQQITTSKLSGLTFTSPFGTPISVVGETLIGWAGPWNNRRKHQWLRFAPVIYVTRCCVVEGAPRGTMVLGFKQLKEHGLIEDDCYSVSSEDSEDPDAILPFDEIGMYLWKSSS